MHVNKAPAYLSACLSTRPPRTSPFTSRPNDPPKHTPAYPHTHGHAAKQLTQAQNFDCKLYLHTCTPTRPRPRSQAVSAGSELQFQSAPMHPHTYPCLLLCRETKRSKGIAYVLFQIPEDAVRAHAELDMTTFQVGPALPSPPAATPGSPALCAHRR